VDAMEDSPEFLAFAAGLRPGPPPDGQAYLREAFTHYQHQRHESDGGTRAAWILLANLKIGLHEQTRLQPHPFLDSFVKTYDPCPPGGTNCGATDWCDLRQRMHYIVHLFRAYAETGSLFVPPFTPEQVASFRADIVPKGDL
jgi:hypothetical protein